MKLDVNDMVMYSGVGLCKVVDIRMEKLAGEERKYYILNPENNTSTTTVYVPVGSHKLKLKKVLSKQEIYDLIHSITLEDSIWIEDERQRKDFYTQALRDGDHVSLIKLIREAHESQEIRIAEGKKSRVMDDKFIKDAQKAIHEEFAYSLCIKEDEVAPFIMGQLEL